VGLWEEQAVTPLSFKGLELSDESPPFKWEWFSDPLDCPSNEGCNPEPMRGTPASRRKEVSLLYPKPNPNYPFTFSVILKEN